MDAKALKLKILDLAIHGKLLPLEKVEKIRKEEPASALLEKIRAEKEEKIAKGELKRNKKDSFIFLGDDKRHYEKLADGTVKDIEDEIPFDVPEGWSWCRLGEICEFIGGGTPDKANQDYWNGNIHWASVKDIKDDYLFSTEDKITELGLTESSANLAKIDDIILITRISPGKATIAKIETAINQDLKIVIPKIKLEKLFLLYFIQNNESDFIENSSGTTVKGIKLEYLLSKLFPLPPLAEQQLIVAEIEKIFAQIDSLEQNKTDLQTAIKQAKSKILDLAIRGKLVPQDPNDEPASALLEKIRAEKEAKIAKGELKRDKNDSYIYKGSDNCHYEKFADGTVKDIEDEIPFDMPENWCWVQLPELCSLPITDGTHNSPPTSSHGDFLYITAKNIKPNGIDLSNATYVSKDIHEKIYKRCPVKKKDVLLTKDGTIGEVTVNNLDCQFSLLSSVALIKPMPYVLSWFVAYVLRSDYLQNKMKENAKGSALKRIILEQINSFFIPLPPLAEQQRIVSKIEELFSLLNQIQTNLI